MYHSVAIYLATVQKPADKLTYIEQADWDGSQTQT